MREKNIEEYTRQYPYSYCTVHILLSVNGRWSKRIQKYNRICTVYTGRSWNNLLFVQLFIYNQYSYNHSFNNQSSYNHSFNNQSSNNHSLNNQSSYNHSFNNQSSNNHSFNNQSSYNHSLNNQSSYNQSLNNQSLNN